MKPAICFSRHHFILKTFKVRMKSCTFQVLLKQFIVGNFIKVLALSTMEALRGAVWRGIGDYKSYPFC